MVQRERRHDREKERKRRKKRKYGQAKLKHAKRGILSCALSLIVLILLIAMLAKAYISRGGAAPFIGAMGIVTMILAGGGLYAAIRGFREREKDYLTCKIGAASCSLLLLGFIFIFCRGLF